MIDSIASASTQLSQIQLKNQVEMAMLDKTLETAKSQGNAMVETLYKSAGAVQQQTVVQDPNLGQQVDIKV